MTNTTLLQSLLTLVTLLILTACGGLEEDTATSTAEVVRPPTACECNCWRRCGGKSCSFDADTAGGFCYGDCYTTRCQSSGGSEDFDLEVSSQF